MRWWTSRGVWASWVRDEQCKLLRQVVRVWGRLVVHVFERGYESLVWLGALSAFAVRFVLRWRHDYRLVDAQGQRRLAWKIVQGKRAWGKGRPLWDARRRTHVQASVFACPVTHPDFPRWQLWLVVGQQVPGRHSLVPVDQRAERDPRASLGRGPGLCASMADRTRLAQLQERVGHAKPTRVGMGRAPQPLRHRDAGLCLPVASSLARL
jgi:hypothetical protein